MASVIHLTSLELRSIGFHFLLDSKSAAIQNLLSSWDAFLLVSR